VNLPLKYIFGTKFNPAVIDPTEKRVKNRNKIIRLLLECVLGPFLQLVS